MYLIFTGTSLIQSRCRRFFGSKDMLITPYIIFMWAGVDSNHHPRIFSPVRSDHLRYQPINIFVEITRIELVLMTWIFSPPLYLLSYISIFIKLNGEDSNLQNALLNLLWISAYPPICPVTKELSSFNF